MTVPIEVGSGDFCWGALVLSREIVTIEHLAFSLSPNPKAYMSSITNLLDDSQVT